MCPLANLWIPAFAGMTGEKGASPALLTPHSPLFSLKSPLFSLKNPLTLLALPPVPRLLERLLGGGVLARDAGYRLHVLVGGRSFQAALHPR